VSAHDRSVHSYPLNSQPKSVRVRRCCRFRAKSRPLCETEVPLVEEVVCWGLEQVRRLLRVLIYTKNCPKVQGNTKAPSRAMKGNYLRFKCRSRGSPKPKQASPSLVMKGFCDTLSAVSVGSVADTQRRPSSCRRHKRHSIWKEKCISLKIFTSFYTQFCAPQTRR
jgi:hypothetical protein